MTSIKNVIDYLETIAPLSYQESYDNSGLLTGDADAIVTGVLITLDTIAQVIDEAIEKKCNLIISHHPIIFKGLKSLTGKNYIERTIIKAIKNDIAIYAIHTNLDNVAQGVNKKICDKIGLVDTMILAPKPATLVKLVTFIPKQQAAAVKAALFEVGAGHVGNYSDCSFEVDGTGHFTANEGAHPTIGALGQAESVKETRVELVLPQHKSAQVINRLKEVHPYDEVAYYLTELKNKNQEAGAGMMGSLLQDMPVAVFLAELKEKMSLKVIRHTALLPKKIRKVAVCGGSGSFLLQQAISAGADIFITADMKYHEFFDAENNIVVADIGHYESEVFTKELLSELLSKKFTSFALNLSKIVTNPISYL